MKRHAYSALFPDMQPAEFDALVANIAENGYDPLFPITIYEGQVLDGWHRHRACLQLKIKPTRQEFEGGDSEALLFAVRANGQRRNLSAGQLAYIACDIAPLFQEAAKKRQLASLKQNAPLAPPGANGKTSEQVAKILGVGGRSVERMLLLRKEAPELADSVRIGDTTVFEAYNQHIANKRAAEAEIARKAEEERKRQEADEERRQRALAEKRAKEAAVAEQKQREAAEQARRQQEEAERKKREAEQSKSKVEAERLRKEAAEAEARRRSAAAEEEKQRRAALSKKSEAETASSKSTAAAAAARRRQQEAEESQWKERDKKLRTLAYELNSLNRDLHTQLKPYVDENRLVRIPDVLHTLTSDIVTLCKLAGIQHSIPTTPIKERKIVDV